MMPIGEILKILGAATANEDPKDGHPQQQPLGVYAPLGAPASPAVPAGSQSDRDLQKAGLRDESSADETGTRLAAPVVLCLPFSRPWMEGLVIRCGTCTP